MKGERGKATDFSIAAIMAPRGPTFGHYHLQGLAGNASANTECASKAFVAAAGMDHREFFLDCLFGKCADMYCRWFDFLDR